MKMFFFHTSPRIIPVIVFLAIGIFFRLYRFDTIPFGLHHDGALEGLEAMDLAARPLPYRPYSVENPWLGETMYRYILAAIMSIFGHSAIVLKSVSTAFGIATLPVYFLLAYELFGSRIGLLSLFFLSVSGWHIILGKSAWRAMSLPFFECLALWLFLVFIRHPKKSLGVILGIVTGLTIHTYNAGRVIPLLAGVWLGFIALNKKIPRLSTKVHSPWIIGVIFFIITVFPLGIFAFRHPDVFQSRAAYLSVGNRIKEEGSLKPLWENTVRTARMFTVEAGGDDFFVNEPLLDPPVTVLFIAGFIVTVWRLRKRAYALTVIGFIVTLLPGLLSFPNGNRNIGVLPFVYIFIGIGADAFFTVMYRIVRRKVLAYMLVAGLCIWTIYITYTTYFGNNRRLIFGFYPETTIVSAYMAEHSDGMDYYLTDNFPRNTLTFLTYRGGDPYVKHYTWFETDTEFLDVSPSTNRSTIFFMLPYPDHDSILFRLQEKFPDGKRFELPLQEPGYPSLAAKGFIVPPTDVSSFGNRLVQPQKE